MTMTIKTLTATLIYSPYIWVLSEVGVAFGKTENG